MATTPRYEYNTFDGHYFSPGQEHIITVERQALLVTEDDTRFGSQGFRGIVYVYDPEHLEFDNLIDGCQWNDDDDAALPWFVPLLDFGKEN